MFCYKRKNSFIKRSQEEWKHDKEYNPYAHNDLHVCIDLLYDFKGHDPKGHGYLCERFDKVKDPKSSQVH